jgi:O-antigen/teichoic acid export membrane protein
MAMRGARWVGAGLADQVVMATANAANTLLPIGLLASRSRAGALVLSVGLGYLVLSVNRAFVGDVLLAMVSRLEGAERARMVRHALAAAVVVGCLAAVILLAVWAFWRHPTDKIDLQDLVWVAPFLPIILLHDTGRYVYLSARDPGKALVIDLIWTGTQAVVIVLMVVTGSTSAGLLLASWGLGACVGGTTFLLRSGARPWRGNPRRWLAETRRLSGWFTATTLVGQIQVQAVGFLVTGRMSQADLAVLRSGQTALLQPVQNFVMAMMGLLVPRSSRLAGAGDGAGLRRQTVRIAAAFAGLAVLMVAVVVPVARALQPYLGPYAVIVPLTFPISIQAGIYLLQIPFTAAMRGMQRARLLFVQYLLFSVISLTGLTLGAARGGLRPAAWGLTIGAGTGLVVMVALYAWAVAGLPTDPPAPVSSTDPSSAAQTPAADGRPSATPSSGVAPAPADQGETGTVSSDVRVSFS